MAMPMRSPRSGVVSSPPPSATHSRDEDARLLMALQAGDGQAFNMLVRHHAERFYRVAYRYTAHPAEAEDVVQEAFLKLWERPGMWEARRNIAFTTWFYRVVVNICLDRQKKKRLLPLLDEAFVPDTRDTQEEVVIGHRRQTELEAQIAALPERQRTALNLCFYEHLSNQEAAQVMGVRLKALQSLLMRAKQTLKERLQEY